MCVLWFNNYGLKIPFFSKKKYSKKNSEVGHTKLPKFLLSSPSILPTSGSSGSLQILAKIPGNQLKLN